jgi:hypothetical protein
MVSTPSITPFTNEGHKRRGKREPGFQPRPLSDKSSSTERSSPVILIPFASFRVNSAKDLAADRARPFAALRVTRGDWSTFQALFFTNEACLNNVIDETSNNLNIGNLLTAFLV